MLRVTVNKRAFDLSIKRIKSNLEMRRPMLELIGARLVAYTRQTISQQGRGRGWKKIAPSTALRTGRNKVLTPLIPFIKYRVNNRFGVTVYFSKRPKNWSLDMHEKGFTSPAVKGKFMRAPHLGKFMSRNKSIIPGRRIWPTARVVQQIVSEISGQWVRDVARRSWR